MTYSILCPASIAILDDNDRLENKVIETSDRRGIQGRKADISFRELLQPIGAVNGNKWLVKKLESIER